MMKGLMFAVVHVGSALLAMLPSLGAAPADHRQAMIEWDPSTLKLVAPGGGYGRIIRLRSGELLCGYQRRGQSCIRRSSDEGRNWSDEHVVTGYRHGVAANPELMQRRNGELWLLFNERPRKTGEAYTIALMVSCDEGRTWGKSRRLFAAGKEFENGCWEPVALEYPDGEVQVFFANEAPYTESKEQEISMVSARDFGKVHSVAFRAGARDGMPVPRLLKDGKTVVMAIEDSGLHGRMKPVILSSAVESRWTEGVVDGGSSRRRAALKQGLGAKVYAGAPYLTVMDSGITLLSVQSDEGRDEPRMVVYLGDERAQNFDNPSVPFAVESGNSGLWNSLFAKDADTVTAVSGCSLNGRRGIWTIDGRLKPR